jgi:hypothetical protein
MAKGKKKKKNKNKNKTFYKSIKPFIRDNRVLYSILGAVGVGVAIASALGTDKGRSLVDKLSSAVKDLTPDQLTADHTESESALPEKKPKSVKQFATE